MGIPHKEYRCATCQKLLFKGFLVEGEVEIKCRSCRELTTVAASEGDKLICLIEDCPHRVRSASQKA